MRGRHLSYPTAMQMMLLSSVAFLQLSLHCNQYFRKVFFLIKKITNGFAPNLWQQCWSVAFGITRVCIELISTVVHFPLGQAQEWVFFLFLFLFLRKEREKPSD